MHTIASATVAAISVIAAVTLIAQCRKPRGWPGRFYVRLMNATHSGLTSWGLDDLSIAQDATILDIGCGGGKTVRRLAGAAAKGKVFGVDYSSASVRVSQKTNADLIAAGRVDIRESSVSRLPFGDNMFDLVTAIETHYYWPDPEADYREVLRVLKPGGKLVILAEVYRHGKRDYIDPLAMGIVGGRCWTIEQQTDQLARAGHETIAVRENRRKGWLRLVTTKPGSGAPAA